MKSEDIQYERNVKTPESSSSSDESGIFVKETINTVDKNNDDIQV